MGSLIAIKFIFGGLRNIDYKWSSLVVTVVVALIGFVQLLLITDRHNQLHHEEDYDSPLGLISPDDRPLIQTPNCHKPTIKE